MSLNDVDDDEMSVKSSLVCYQSINQFINAEGPEGRYYRSAY